ncbi:MAG TPA: hypothetical protein VM345_00445 [Acidimicrobiales bacterium]|nr:hypothetical protein [Acidimicrobiales bacterium]
MICDTNDDPDPSFGRAGEAHERTAACYASAGVTYTLLEIGSDVGL